MANISLEVVFKMFFLTLSGTDINFLGWKLRWRAYTTKEALLTTRCIELVGKKKFAITVLDPEYETYVVYVGSVNSNALSNSSLLDVYPFQRPQISGLIAKKIFTKILAKYSDFADVFSPNLASKLPELTRINNHAIKLVDGQQPPYGPIYNLKLVELEILKAYIKTNLVNRFIRSSKSPAGTFILFDWKSDSFF